MNEVLKAELSTWLLSDEEKRWEKLEREKVRYPKMLEEMGVNLLRLDNKIIIDVGSGPISALVYIPEAIMKVAVDPLIDEYVKVIPRDTSIVWIQGVAENLPLENNFAHLVLCMNALDHFENPAKAIKEMWRILRPGGFLAVHCCINNSIINPHPAHKHSLTYSWFRDIVDKHFECIVSRLVRYGWRRWRNKVGQLAFAYMGRKVDGY